MKYKLEFKNWLMQEGNIFGFPEPTNPSELTVGDLPPGPVAQFDWDFLNEQLASRSMGELRGKSLFINEINWGDQPGAVQLAINTWYGAAINKLGTDLSGNSRWYTKKLFEINRNFFAGREKEVVEALYSEINKVHQQPIDSPVRGYKDLFKLVVEMAEKVRQVMTPVFQMGKIHKINEDRYIIQLNVSGYGVGNPDNMRSEENLIDVSYSQQDGVIRVINADVESPATLDHKWEIQPSDLDMYFFPTQSRSEIIETISVYMKFY